MLYSNKCFQSDESFSISRITNLRGQTLNFLVSLSRPKLSGKNRFILHSTSGFSSFIVVLVIAPLVLSQREHCCPTDFLTVNFNVQILRVSVIRNYHLSNFGSIFVQVFTDCCFGVFSVSPECFSEHSNQ